MRQQQRVHVGLGRRGPRLTIQQTHLAEILALASDQSRASARATQFVPAKSDNQESPLRRCSGARAAPAPEDTQNDDGKSVENDRHDGRRNAEEPGGEPERATRL